MYITYTWLVMCLFSSRLIEACVCLFLSLHCMSFAVEMTHLVSWGWWSDLLIRTSHSSTDIRHPEELSVLRKPRDPKKKKKKLEEAEEEALELEGPLLTPGSGTSRIAVTIPLRISMHWSLCHYLFKISIRSILGNSRFFFFFST